MDWTRFSGALDEARRRAERYGGRACHTPCHIPEMTHMLSLMLSLLFGAGQVVVGVLLVGYGLRAGRWRRLSLYVALLFGVWCVTSGLAELLVSGMETARHVVGRPSVSAFALWRAR